MQSKKVSCIGITNRVIVNKDTQYIPFLDYDNISLKKLTDEICDIATKWGLGWCYIFKTNDDDKHYHVLSPTLISPYEYLGILWDSTCDMPYKKSFFLLKEKTLRISDKNDKRQNKFPICVVIIKNETAKYYSGGHLSFLQKMYKAEIPTGKLFNTDVEFVKYKTKHLNEK